MRKWLSSLLLVTLLCSSLSLGAVPPSPPDGSFPVTVSTLSNGEGS